MLDSGTIVAVATAEGKSGLAVVRLSGPEALNVARRILPDGLLAEPVTSHRARLAMVRWPADVASSTGDPEAGTPLDQVLVLPLLAPNSYTGEDTIEFSCHGGALPARLVSAACRAAGARSAGPGEFTRRAFLNGRLSLDQAEAVADLIDAEHAAGARAALYQLRGALDEQLAAVEDPLRALLAELEGSLEFTETEEMGPAPEQVRDVLTETRRRVADLLALVPAGRRLRDGVQVALAGPPNAGKSSLFNSLLGRERALVDDAPGTTRDVVSESIELEGLRFVLHDTAGLHEAAAGVEARGIALTHEVLDAADIVLYLRPLAAGLPAMAEPVAAPVGSTLLSVWTKGDLENAATCTSGLVTSSLTGDGIPELKQMILDVARDDGLADAVARGIVLNERHRDRLVACQEALGQVLDAVDAGDEVVASLLAVSLQELGAISGRVFSEQILGAVFNRFCIGK